MLAYHSFVSGKRRLPAPPDWFPVPDIIIQESLPC